MPRRPYLSVIIPTYNEEKCIGHTLSDLKEWLDKEHLDYEILIVLDGPTDRTRQMVRTLQRNIQNLILIDNQVNHGKGHAVRQGLLKAEGEFRIFMDADCSTSLVHLGQFLRECGNRYPVVIGSRNAKGSVIAVRQPRYRELMGDIGNHLIRVVLGLWEYRDTQCGFKMLSRHAAEDIIPRMKLDRFGFDFELIALAKSLDYGIRQMPVTWRNDDKSSVTLFGANGFVRILTDLFRTKLRLLTGSYGRER
jgi:dolichyl-phosphate beta-glucosyltransferase